MIIATVADLHLRGKDLELTRQQLHEVAHQAQCRGVDLVNLAGDIFDRPDIGDKYASTGAIAEVANEFVAALVDSGMKAMMIAGQHDVAGVGSKDALHIFDNRLVDDVGVVRGPRVIGNICYLPWEWSGKDAQKVLTKCLEASGECDLLVAHVQVVGAKMGAGFCAKSKPGNWEVSRDFLASLPVRHFALGDFHARQEVVEGKGGYVGALRQLNFGEEGNPAGFEVWNSETDETEWVEIGIAPRYRTVEVLPGELPPKPAEGERLKIQYIGGTLDHAEARTMEMLGAEVEHIVEREERIARAEVPAGIIDDAHGLIRLWAEQQTPAVEGERLEEMLRLYDSTVADKPEAKATPEPAREPEPKPEPVEEDLLAAAAAGAASEIPF